MYRTFRLGRRKNEFRKARGRTVSVQHGSVIDVVSIQPTSQSSSHGASSQLSPSSIYLPPQDSVEELIVTIPIEFLRNYGDNLVMKLLEQIKTLSVLPHGMIDISHVCLVFDI